MGGALGFDVGRVEGGRFAGPSGPGQGLQHGGPEAAARPPVEAVVDGRVRAVLARAILPAAAGLDDVQDARQNGAIVLAMRTGLVCRHERRDYVPVLVRQPEQLCHSLLHPGDDWNHISLILAMP